MGGRSGWTTRSRDRRGRTVEEEEDVGALETVVVDAVASADVAVDAVAASA